jgi:hypothetical protein
MCAIKVEIGLRNMNLNEKNILLLAHQLENSCEFPRALELYSKSGHNEYFCHFAILNKF